MCLAEYYASAELDVPLRMSEPFAIVYVPLDVFEERGTDKDGVRAAVAAEEIMAGTRNHNAQIVLQCELNTGLHLL